MPVRKNSPKNASIIVPIFNAANDLASLLKRLHGIPYPTIFVDDASDDPRISILLNEFKKDNPLSSVIYNKENQGFVASVNQGIRLTSHHAILLNSDTLPPKGDWVSRLLEPIEINECTATVTPLSNNAEILSIPHACVTSSVSASFVDYIDLFSKRITNLHSAFEIPTGIGFCMAINRKYIDAIGDFDIAFGRGYGEEVDWCQKAIQAGGRNVGLGSLFVGHKGGASFGKQKSNRILEASKIISARYPQYESNVHNWIKNSPAQAQKLVASVAWLSSVSNEPVPVFFGHSMGGGAEAALQKQIGKELATKPGVVILRVGGPTIWRIELKGNGFSLSGDASDEETVAQILAPLQRKHLIYSCGVGGRHPMDTPSLIMRFLDENCPLDMHIHDFFSNQPILELAGFIRLFSRCP